MMLTSISLLTKAADSLGIAWRPIGSSLAFIELTFPTHTHRIINNTLGLISNVDEKIAVDKAFQYELLHKDIAIPNTLSFLDPNGKYQPSELFSSVDRIAAQIQEHFRLPHIIKKNSGSRGEYAFLINRADQISPTISQIFNHHDSRYDYILLAQEYIPPAKEYRAVCLRGKVELCYEKNISDATFSGNLSPLHWENAHAVSVDKQSREKIEKFLQPLFARWPIAFAGIDIIEDKQGQLWLIEVNSSPSVAIFVRDNGEREVTKLYQKILKLLSEPKASS